jgi:HK97 family phage portal protein
VNLLQKAYEWLSEAFTFRNGAFVRVWGQSPTAAGKIVTPENSLQTIAVLRCSTLIAGAWAMLPMDVHQKRGGKRISVDTHPLEQILNREANPEQDAMQVRSQLALSFLLWGNAYAVKVFSGSRLIALWPLNPGLVDPKRQNGELVFEYQPLDKPKKVYRADEILHIPWHCPPGSFVGMSAIRQAAEALGLGAAIQDHASFTLKNGATPSIIIEHPAKLSPDAHKRLQESVEKRHSGAENAARPMILEEGMKAQTHLVNFRELQFLEQMQYSDERTAMLFGVPPHMIGLVSKSTSWGTGIGEQKQGFMDFTLGPINGFFERAFNRQCFSAAEKASGLYVKANLTAFLRADIEKRNAAYAVAVDKGWLDRNEVRALEDLDPFEGGDVKTIQQQMIPLQLAGEHIRIAREKARQTQPSTGGVQ